MFSRLLSNVLVLLLFGMMFFGVTVLINWFAIAEEESDQEYSFERRTADLHYQRGNYEASARYYGKLIESDPNNGAAHFARASALNELRLPLLKQYIRELRSDEPDEAALESIRDDANEIGTETIAAFEQVLPFPQFRNIARFQLARLHAFADDSDQALEYLTAAFEDGFRPDRPVTQYLELQTLRGNAEFDRLR